MHTRTQAYGPKEEKSSSSAAAAAASGEAKEAKSAAGSSSSSNEPVNPLYDVFLRILLSKSGDEAYQYQIRKASRILSVLLSSPDVVDASNPAPPVFFRWLAQKLNATKGHTQLKLVHCVKELLKNKSLHGAFQRENVLAPLAQLLSKDTSNTQLLYVVGFCIWLLSFNAEMFEDLHAQNVVLRLAGIVRVATREKILRISFATLVNLLGKGMLFCAVYVRTSAEMGGDVTKVSAKKKRGLLRERAYHTPSLSHFFRIRARACVCVCVNR